jgi:uncharacterized protein (DUF58 family)
LLEHATLREGETTTWRATADGGDGIDRFALSLGTDPASRLIPMRGALIVAAAADGRAAEATVVITSLRWGRRDVGSAAAAAFSAWAAFRSGPLALVPGVMTTLPLPAVFDNRASAPNPQGIVGSHHSRRQADGVEFATIRPFAVGDRLRRIHWPVSLRTGLLHVSATLVDADTQVVLVIDASNDVGARGPFDGPASSLDRSVRAAGALAEHFLRRGDRVGLRTAGSSRNARVPIAPGHAHLRRILFALASVEHGGGRVWRAEPRPLGIPPGGLIVVLTPLLSPAAMEQVLYLARRHPTVLVVDTMPDDIAATTPPPARALAWRIRLLERASDIARLQGEGVPVVAWRGPGSLDVVLRDLNRRARAPRLVVR